MKYDAIIFDLDGVICSTDEYHYMAWKQIADELDIPFNREINNRLRGISRMESLEIILERYTGPALTKEEKEDLASEKNEYYRIRLQAMKEDDCIPEVRETLGELRKMGLRLAIGSSSRNTPIILERLGMGHFFDAVSDGNNILHSKPDPEVFQKAAEMLWIEPARCLVVEDSVSGVQAGHAAGMEVACVGNASQRKAGDYNLSSFGEILDLMEDH